MFTKTFDTTAGQLLYFKEMTEDNEYAIKVIGECINGINPAAVLSYEGDEQARDDAFDKITEEAAESTAQSFVQMLQGSFSGAPDLDA